MDRIERVALRHRVVSPNTVLALATLDLTALTALLMGAGGAHNPLLFAYLAYLAVLGMVLPARLAWGASFAAMALEAAVLLRPGQTVDLLDATHALSHVATFDLSAAGITWVVTRLSAALRAQEQARADAARRRELTERLAALGALAAGVTHELGTPLGTIQLLGEALLTNEIGPSERDLVEDLLRQVDRCRALLDRLRSQDGQGADVGPVEPRAWVEEWHRTAPGMRLSWDGAPSCPDVVGGEHRWRQAVWVALDNARKAEATSVKITLDWDEALVRLQIEDDGHGLDEHAAQRAGEPFWTGWGSTGLGLFVSRRFAQAVGGDLSLEPAPDGGALAVLLMPREAS